MKKFISVILAFVILALAFPVFANAGYYDTQISVGDVVWGSIWVDDGALQLYFIPEESGYYTFYSQGKDSPYCTIFDSDFNVLATAPFVEGQNFSVTHYFNAGEVYYIYTSIYWYVGMGDYTVSVKREVPPAVSGEVFIYHGGDTWGYVMDTISLQCLSSDEDAYIGTCTWESSAPWIASINNVYGNECNVLLLNEGTATITVTTDVGLCDSFEVTCRPIGTLLTGAVEKISLGECGGKLYYDYSPEEWAEYAISYDTAADISLNITDPNRNAVKTDVVYTHDGKTIEKAELYPWDTYRFEIVCPNGVPDFDLVITPCSEAEAVTIESSYALEGYPGNRLVAWGAVFPETSREQRFSWYTSDPSVAIVGYDDYGCNIDLIAPGTCEITAISESGLSATVTVVCKAAEKIQINETKAVKMGEECVLSFTPVRSGYYSFEAAGIDTSDVYIVSRDWYIVDGTELSLDGVVSHRVYLEKGVEYYLYSCDGGIYADEYTVTIKECKKPTSLYFEEDTVYAHVWEEIVIPFRFGPDGCYWESVERYTEAEPIFDVTVGVSDITVLCREAGKQEILLVSKSGLRATVIIDIAPVEHTPLECDKATSVDTSKYLYSYFSFTPAESGSYTVYSLGKADTYFELTDVDGNFVDEDDDSGRDLNFSYSFDAEAGKTYYFRLSYFGEAEDYEVKIEKSKAATSMSLDCKKTIYGVRGEGLWIVAEFLPDGSAGEAVYWRVSDREVIRCYSDEGSNYCYLELVGDGIATLSAYSDSGFVAEVTVVVGDVAVFGDVNGDGAINSVDSNLLKRSLAGESVEIVSQNADMNADGSVDSRDSNILKRTIAGQM